MKQLFFGLMISGILCTGTVYCAEKQEQLKSASMSVKSEMEFTLEKGISPLHVKGILESLTNSVTGTLTEDKTCFIYGLPDKTKLQLCVSLRSIPPSDEKKP